MAGGEEMVVLSELIKPRVGKDLFLWLFEEPLNETPYIAIASNLVQLRAALDSPDTPRRSEEELALDVQVIAEIADLAAGIVAAEAIMAFIWRMGEADDAFSCLPEDRRFLARSMVEQARAQQVTSYAKMPHPHEEGEPGYAAWDAWNNQVADRLAITLHEALSSNPDVARQVIEHTYTHLEALIAREVAFDIRKARGVERIPRVEFEAHLDTFVENGSLERVIGDVMNINAYQFASAYLTVLDLERMPLSELARLVGAEEQPHEQLPDAFSSGVGRIPCNPALSAALGAIWKGGPRSRSLQAGWSDAGTGKPTYVHMVKQGGRVLVYPNLMHSASDPLPTTEALWAFVESLNPFTADVALAVLAQMVEPSTGDRPKYPLLQPVRITADAILRYKGIQRYGTERRLLEQRVYEEMERLRGLTFDVERVKAYDAGSDRWPKEGASWEGDRLFDIVKVEKWQETLIEGERQRIEVAWSVRAGQWAYWWLNAQGRVYVSRMARVLLELDHRENRPAAVMAKKIGQLLALWRASETLERRIDGLLQDIGELPEPQKRDKDWAGRTRDRFDEAMLTLQEAGVFVNVEWPDGYGPGDKDRSKGWVAGWLAAKVRITLPRKEVELPEPPPKLPAPKRKRRAKQPAKVQLLDGSAIRRARTERGWTQQDLARHLGIAPAYLSQIESGKRLPSKELAGKLKVWLEEA